MTATNEQTWVFDPLDTLFFKESRPMDSLGNAELGSIFPPTARTMAGAVRSAIGELNDIDWNEYHKGRHPLARTIGYGDDDLGCLSFGGVWIQKNETRLYPVPLNVMCQKDRESSEQLFFISISEQLSQTDIGTIRLPRLTKDQAGSKVLENIWFSAEDFHRVLRGEVPEVGNFFELKSKSLQDEQTGCLLVEEARVGIARDNATRSVHKGLLYQTRHIRLADGVSLAVDVCGLQVDKTMLTRLGGEGRMASISIQSVPDFPKAPETTDFKIEQDGTVGFVIYLLTPLLFENRNEVFSPLPDFLPDHVGMQKVWKGSIEGIPVTIHTAITGKAHREGGWDLPNRKPKPVKSYTPPGSVFYCTSTAGPQEIVARVHGGQIGEEQKLGRGKIAVGVWK